MTTARDIIKGSFLKIGVLTKGEDMDAGDAQDALSTLKSLLASLSNAGDVIYSRTRETFNLSTSASYTIGIGQTFDTVRPIQIVEAFVTSGGADYPVTIVNQEQYDAIRFKGGISGIPQFMTYDGGYPYGNISLYPVPAGVYSITLLSEKDLNSFATLDTDLILPSGWERALVYNLAVELAPEYGQQVTPVLMSLAKDSLGLVKLAVVRSRPVLSIRRLKPAGNIYTGWNT